MSFQKHNRWSRVIPPGFTCTNLKNQLRVTTLSERERSVCRLVLDTAEPTEFTLTVKFISDSIGFSAAKTWPRVRDLLVSKGILAFRAEELGGGEKRWHLNFDFTPLAAGLFDLPADDLAEAEELSTDADKKKGSLARACDPPHLVGSHDPAQSGGSRDPTVQGGLEPDTFEPEKTTTNAAAAPTSASTGKEEDQLPGLTEAERGRVMKKLTGASEEQKELACQIYRVRRHSALDPAGLAISLASQAAKNALCAPRLQIAPVVEADQSAAVCAAHAHWRGDLVGPTGARARSKSGDEGQVRDHFDRLFSLSESAALWRRIEAGELDFIAA